MRGVPPVDRQTAQIRRDFDQIKEKVETLTGTRGAKGNSAVLRQDLSRLTEIGELSSKKVAAAPTMDDFNALVDDVHSIHRQLAAISRAIG